MRHFKLVRQVDVQPLLGRLNQRSDLWNTSNVRTWHRASPHYGASDIVLRFQSWEDGEDYLDKVCATMKCVDYPAFKLLPEAREIVTDIADGAELGRVFISRIKPGGVTHPHADRILKAEKLYPDRPVYSMNYTRYHLILQSARGIVFHTEDEEIEMQAGQVWRHNCLARHWVKNDSDVEWLQMAFDVR